MNVPDKEQLDSEDARQAFRINRFTKERVLAAPEPKLVWNQFIKWVKGYNKKKGGPLGAPIAAGKNIRNFDFRFVNDLNERYADKKGKTVLFSTRRQLDLEDLIFYWFEGTNDLLNEKMDTLRDYFGLDHEGAHDALIDCRQEGGLVIKFLKLARDLRRRKTADGKQPFIKFEGALAKKAA
jgi:DNA polymerase III epsilon subunit-like protein